MQHGRLSRALTGTVAGAVVVASLTGVGTARAATDPGWLPSTGIDGSPTVTAFATVGSTVYAGTAGAGVVRSADAGRSWVEHAQGATGGAADVRDLTAAGTEVVAATAAGVFRSTAGAPWQRLGPPGGVGAAPPGPQTIVRVGGVLLIGSAAGVARSGDAGATWQDAGAGLPRGTSVTSLDTYPGLPGTVLAATSAGVFRSSDQGRSWIALTAGLPTIVPVRQVMVDRTRSSRWFAATEGAGVYRSTDSGTSWHPASQGLGRFLRTTVVDQYPIDGSYRTVVGTDDGLFLTYDDGDSWEPITDTGLIGSAVTSATTPMPATPGGLLIGTQNGGVHHRLMIPPTEAAQPVLNSSAPVVGQTLTTTWGEWEGTGRVDYRYEWQRCPTAQESSCVTIAGQRATSYLVTAADVGQRLRSLVRAVNPAAPGGVTAGSALTDPVAGNAQPLPGESSRPAPVITTTGPRAVGETMTAAVSPWTPTATWTQYRWWRCDAAGQDCDRSGVGRNYRLRPADGERRMRVQVLQQNAAGTVASTLSPPTAAVVPEQVAAVTPPLVHGTPWLGQVVTRSTGSFADRFARAETTWQTCATAAGASCTTLVAGDRAAIRLGPAALGRYVRVLVAVDVNGADRAPAPRVVPSATVGPVIPVPVAVSATVAPVVRGLPVATGLLTIERGRWTGAPAFTHRWLRCAADGTACLPIPGATAGTYRLTTADVGRRVVAQVSATNSLGRVTVRTNSIGPVVAAWAPRYRGGAVIRGKVRVGRTLRARPGAWEAVPAAQLRYRWTRDGAPIPRATRATYRLRAKDRTHRIGVRITATNAAGSSVLAVVAGRLR